VTNAAALALDYLRRARMRIVAVEALIAVGDFADADEALATLRSVLETIGLAFTRNGTPIG
jgi:hypothetical protein